MNDAPATRPGRRRSREFRTEYGCYVVADHGGSIPLADADPWERLIHPGTGGTGGALIVTGTFNGAVEVQVEVLDEAPDPEPDDAWEQTEHHRLVALGETVGVYETEGEERGFDRLEVDPGQAYHLRVHARGRDAARGYVTGPDLPVEHHLVQLWPVDV